MSDSETMFYILLRSGLWGSDICDIDKFHDIDVDLWSDIYKISKAQTVQGIVYDGILKLPHNFMPPDNILMRWVADVDIIERDNIRMNNVLCALDSFWSSLCLNPVLLKGQGVASFYDKPEMRMSGDIDIYFPKSGDLAKAVNYLFDKGFDVNRQSDGTFVFVFMDVIVELHPQMIDINSPFKESVLQKIISEYGFESLKYSPLSGTGFKAPTAFLNCILLNAHIMKHAFTSGIGLRQICDIARVYYSVDYASFPVSYLRELGIEKWSRLLNTFIAIYLYPELVFGLPDANLNDVNRFRSLIHKDGNMGNEIRTDYSLMDTLTIFYSHAEMIRYAPAEYCWTIASLVRGRVKNFLFR